MRLCTSFQNSTLSILHLKPVQARLSVKTLRVARLKIQKSSGPVSNPYSKTGGIAVLKGNLAPDGCVVKRSAVAEEMMHHKGFARVFDCEEDALNAIYDGKINPRDVVVIRYEGT